MLLKILSNVAYDGKVLLEGETHEVSKKFADDFVSRKVARLEKAETVAETVAEKPKAGKGEKEAEKAETVAE